MSKWDDTMARLDNVVAVASQVKAAAADDLADQVMERLSALEADLGITAPVVAPTTSPEAPQASSTAVMA